MPKKPNGPKNPSYAANFSGGCILCVILLPVCFLFPPTLLVLPIILVLVLIGTHQQKKEFKKQNVVPKKKSQVSQTKQIEGFVEKLDGVKKKIAEMQKDSASRATDVQTSDEMIEITWISGRKQIYMVGKEGWKCHCFRLKSNPNIIRVNRFSAKTPGYPFNLIDTKGAKHSADSFFEQVSLDKKTNIEKTKTKTLISWRLFGNGELEMVYDKREGWKVNEKNAGI